MCVGRGHACVCVNVCVYVCVCVCSCVSVVSVIHVYLHVALHLAAGGFDVHFSVSSMEFLMECTIEPEHIECA